MAAPSGFNVPRRDMNLTDAVREFERILASLDVAYTREFYSEVKHIISNEGGIHNAKNTCVRF